MIIGVFAVEMVVMVNVPKNIFSNNISGYSRNSLNNKHTRAFFFFWVYFRLCGSRALSVRCDAQATTHTKSKKENRFFKICHNTSKTQDHKYRHL
ncbi:hypothetical protein PHYBLDRAFT_159582 [Phycomyces blakesleeanus NRRL 1555(-)]|uniref:Uncharacterized protein n=1 Tax=Phycomyces blakesleeanus (strain ATCC 8743b / DSM 1359 / FGSC 10004 / NBRC 33097 / NRRL 1555) TaxID=763407 RepID=A0A162NIY7_PHYB8|nr:hypothetical protein PHYBLDRAFT_159582 [Phycomyces blakesleeanus NRRL 1555(-)]OAD70104.1 hypothetical protein PHYBLDRAFT_159582 [Phycomyces blakesleeanus NRRL 1555(-)]|eukprot:XP_018288144.1 hypothetical protein PHYBLDRAFT_159582 [Phycomyces blakesleeanus NRRL 1555(-)]